jgi:hypothetical protein
MLPRFVSRWSRKSDGIGKAEIRVSFDPQHQRILIISRAIRKLLRTAVTATDPS